ncbi:lipid A-modifier LpxR family protein [Winogradskyella aurantiaca]|uniref:lipid A-modifier LpxR family protein n=1 Tax=Winogradskyella aurantiaca TaxID=2219558 RepID=UPI000E1D36EB|nr:lipid A-modifier LpxR family protein [Winogradskyella aurantiaca]
MKRSVFALIIAYVLFCQLVNSQNQDPYKFSLHISSDNDAFSAARNFDRYYTYGAGIKLSFKADSILGLQRLFSNKEHYFFNAGIRSEGYTPSRFEFTGADPEEIELNMDRPFAGLLYGTFDVTYIFRDWFFKTELLLGVMGPSAQSKEIQDWIHDNITDDPRFDGWTLQMPDQLIANLNVTGAYNLDINNWFDLYGQARARIGNLFIDATPTVGFRLGKFSSISKTGAFGNNLIADNDIFEIYIRSSFSYTLAAFNGTAQGNLFYDNFQYAVKDLNNFYPSMSHGIFVSIRRFVISWDNYFTYGEVTKGIDHIYGRFGISYRFR